MKKFVALLCGAAFAFSAMNCSAEIASSKISLGGLRPGMTVDEVVKIAGQPKSKSADGENWYYNDFVVEFDDDFFDVVEEIKTEKNSVSTPDGITVGQNDSILFNTYGAADYIKQKRNSVKYTYFSDDYNTKFRFTAVNGVITKIVCEHNDKD